MKVLVTGAGGFLGSRVVAACQAAGHEVLALHRPASAGTVAALPGVTPVFGDLRQPGAWQHEAAGVTGVIHCAAATSGDFPTQLAGTVLATENLLAALGPGLARFVQVSSFSVYDFTAPRFGGRLDEHTPLESQPTRRDAYTQTKLIQERMVRDYCAARDVPLAIVRPGLIYGPGKTWNFGTGLKVGRFDLIFAPRSRMPLTYVDNCAAALVAALDVPAQGAATINMVDEGSPSFWAYHRQASRAGAQVGTAIPVPYLVLLGLGHLARIASRLFFGGRARLPEMLDLPRMKVQWRPLRYDRTEAARSVQPNAPVSYRDGIAATVAAEVRSGKS